ncbi:hypothetical protein LXL04_007953 [Taraxacum kok-saghyz]
MEFYENFIDQGWVNMSSMFSGDQDSSHFTSHRLISGEHRHDLDSILWESPNESNNSITCSIDDHGLVYGSDYDLKPTFYNYFSQESSINPTDIFQFCNSETPTDNGCHQFKDLGMIEGDSTNLLFLAQVFSDDAMEEILCLKEDDEEMVKKGKIENSHCQAVPMKETPIKRKYQNLEDDGNGNTEIIDNRKKKSRVARDNKNKKNLPPMNKKMTSATNSNEDETKEKQLNNEDFTQNISSSCSEDDSNASQDVKEGPINVTQRPRASRGAATDPQSVYARKRRERINEKLRILQNIVPNGTKVDMSTMLEEAVQYVKFLQLQIKLLSSDDMWMYAPIAYNGMDMGLYQNMSHNL